MNKKDKPIIELLFALISENKNWIAEAMNKINIRTETQWNMTKQQVIKNIYEEIKKQDEKN